MTSETPDAPDALPSYVEDVLLDHEDNDDVLTAIEKHAAALREADTGPEQVQAKTSDGQVIEVYEGDDESLVEKMQQCGDETCQCMNGGDKHGPYLWRVQHHDDAADEWEWVGKVVEDENPA